MRVAIIDGDISYPPTSGKRIRTLSLMMELAKRHRITYVGRGTPNSVEMREAPAYLRDHGIDPVLVADPIAKKSGPMFYAGLAANLLSPLPFSVTSHQSPRFRAALTDLARVSTFDLWQFEWAGYVPALDRRLGGPRLVCAHNVDTLIWQRYAQYETRPFHRWFIRGQERKFKTFEEAAFKGASRVVAVTNEDAHRIRFDFAQPNVDVVENGVDVAHFAGAVRQPAPRRKNVILYIGALDWRPNLDAVDLLLNRIFPKVRAQLPDASLEIVGRSPPPSLRRRVSNEPGVSLHADVPDVRSYLASASLMAVPLRIGGGSRLKILEALASRLPVVSTGVGAEGLNLVPGIHYVWAEYDKMADAILEGLSRPDQIEAMADAGMVHIASIYDWTALALKLEESWKRCIGDAREND